jgi:nicotinate-nucleotide adenylyltransferase
MIGIYGGSFDPPHLGHVGVIEYFWKSYPESSKLLLVPNYISPFKKEKGVGEKHLLSMLQILIDDNHIANTIIEDVEIKRKETSYTIDTIEFIQKKYPDEELYLIIGTDNLAKFPLWKDYKKILNSTHLLIFNRNLGSNGDFPPELKEFSNRIEFVNNPQIHASSSEIRNLPHEKWNLYLTPKVLEYIEQEELYGFRKTN